VVLEEAGSGALEVMEETDWVGVAEEKADEVVLNIQAAWRRRTSELQAPLRQTRCTTRHPNQACTRRPTRLH